MLFSGGPLSVREITEATSFEYQRSFECRGLLSVHFSGGPLTVHNS